MAAGYDVIAEAYLASQLSPTVSRRVGAANIIIVSTPAKLALTPVLRFDSGDDELDGEMIARKYLEVIIGYRRSRLAKTAG